MVFSRTPCRAAGVFHQQRGEGGSGCLGPGDRGKRSCGTCSGSEFRDRQRLHGRTGKEYCKQTAQAAAEALGIPETAVLVASTGVIGMQLPMDRITAGVKALAGALSDTEDAGREAAEAIMTTDTHSKLGGGYCGAFRENGHHRGMAKEAG